MGTGNLKILAGATTLDSPYQLIMLRAWAIGQNILGKARSSEHWCRLFRWKRPRQLLQMASDSTSQTSFVW